METSPRLELPRLTAPVRWLSTRHSRRRRLALRAKRKISAIWSSPIQPTEAVWRRGSKVEITIPEAFAAVPFEPASDDDNRSGAVVLIGPADLTVAGQALTAVLTGELEHAVGTLTFIYKGVKAPAAEGSYTFKARASSGPEGGLTILAADEQKNRRSHGSARCSGTISLTRGESTFRQADKELQLGNLTFTYTAAGRMAKGAMVQITIPEGWTSAHLDNGDRTASPGEVALSGKADLEVDGGGATPWKLIAKANAALVAGDKLVFTYKSVQAPADAGVVYVRNQRHRV